MSSAPSSVLNRAANAATADTPAGAWWVMLPLMIAAFMSLLDVTIVNVALPSISANLGGGQNALAWIVAGYTLAFGLVLIPAGRIGDLTNHRTVFLVGLILFTLTSLVAGLAQNAEQLIALRALQGFSAGLFNPAISAFIQLMFPGPQRGKAFGMLGAVIGLSTAVGPLLGGVIIRLIGDQNGWRWIFLVNVPIGIVAIVLALRLLPSASEEHRRHREQAAHGSLLSHLDPVGLVLLIVAGITLLLPLVEGQRLGWPLWTWGSFVVAAVASVALVVWERRVERRGGEPVVSVGLFRHPAFTAGTALAMVYFAGFTSIFFTLSIFWQTGLGHDALSAGLVVTPFAVGGFFAAAASSAVAARIGRWVLTLGTGLFAVGLGLTWLVIRAGDPNPEVWLLTVPLLVAGIGNGLFIAPNIGFILATVEPRYAGVASGIVNTAQRIGTAVGIAIISSVLFGTLSVGRTGIGAAFQHSTEVALLVNIGLAIAAFLLVFALPRQAARGGAPADAAADAPAEAPVEAPAAG